MSCTGRPICDIENLLLNAANGMTSELTNEKLLEFWSDIDVEKLKKQLPQLDPFLIVVAEKEKCPFKRISTVCDLLRSEGRLE